MEDLLMNHPWLIIPSLALLIPIFGIVFGTLTNWRIQTHRAELHASLVHEMLQRGMSAEEITMVLEASPKNARKRCHSNSVHA